MIDEMSALGCSDDLDWGIFNCLSHNVTVDEKLRMGQVRADDSGKITTSHQREWSSTTIRTNFSANIIRDYKDKLSNFLCKFSSLTMWYINLLQYFSNSISIEKKKRNMNLNTMCNSIPIRICIVLVSLLIILQLIPTTDASEPLGNPYHILGVSRHATLKEIRKSYKNLVKEW